MERNGAAAVLRGGAARFLELGGRGEVEGAVGELGWARGAPESGGRRRPSSCLGFAHLERTEKEAERKKMDVGVFCEVRDRE